MILYPRTIIVRHRRENLKKCSLRGLESRADLHFIPYPYGELPLLTGYCVLALEGPELSPDDAAGGLVLLDGTWRYAATMLSELQKRQPLPQRSLPSTWRTAYPRRQQDCADPSRGLASVEALFVAYHLMGRHPQGLLDHYHWRDDFLALNASLYPSQSSEKLF